MIIVTHTNKIFVFVTTNNMLHNSSVMQNCSVNIVPVSLSCVSVSQPVAKADQFIDISWWQWSPFLADDIAWHWKQSFTRNSCGRGREIFASQWDNGWVGTGVRWSSAWASAAFYSYHLHWVLREGVRLQWAVNVLAPICFPAWQAEVTCRGGRHAKYHIC